MRSSSATRNRASWGSVQLNPYLRRTSHAVRNIQFVDSTGVSVSTYDNVASTLTIGSRSQRQRASRPAAARRRWKRLSLHERRVEPRRQPLGARNGVVGAQRTRRGSSRRSADAQAFAFYRAPFATEGGSQLASVSMNLAGRYKVWGDQGNISLRVSDPFKLQKFGYRTANGTWSNTASASSARARCILTITRNFGKAIKLQPKQQDPDAQAQTGPPGA